MAMAGAAAAPLANATLLTYDINVASANWSNIGAPAFGLAGQPTLTGWVTVDNRQSGLAAFKDFSFTTGSHTWTLDHYVGPRAAVWFDGNGNLTQFSLANFSYGGVSMYFYSNNTTSIFNFDGYFFCNHCISLTPGAARTSVPEPTTIAMLAMGLFGLAAMRARLKTHRARNRST